MVASVSSGHESTRNVICDAIQGCSENTLASLPSRRTLSRRIQRARRTLNPSPPIPVQPSGFDVPDQYAKTASGLRFLQYDSGADDADRILIMASDENQDTNRSDGILKDGKSFCCVWTIFGTLISQASSLANKTTTIDAYFIVIYL